MYRPRMHKLFDLESRQGFELHFDQLHLEQYPHFVGKYMNLFHLHHSEVRPARDLPLRGLEG